MNVLLAILLAVSPLSIHLNIMRGFEPLTLKVRVSLQPSDVNRHVCVGYINANSGEERQSCRSLDGAAERPTLWYEWAKLPAGFYTVYALVARATGKDLESTTSLEVFSTQ